MLRLLKRFSWLGLLAVSAQVSMGFALLGPVNEPYQVPVIGYNLPGDIGAPKNLAQEYRWNTPVVYYTVDANFWDYFGSNGVVAIDQAFASVNNLFAFTNMDGQVLTNVDNYSPDLSEFPLNSARKNYRAEALFLFDLKSMMMNLLVEQLGLADPDRFTWGLHDRYLTPNTTCPFGENYFIIKRNFDPVYGSSVAQLKPTSYVNGTLLTYQILEICTGLDPLAVTQPFTVDPLTPEGTAVASGFGVGNTFSISPYGNFYTSLTRDDVGGLRYMWRTNNMNVEGLVTNALAEVTNYIPQLLYTSNLMLLAAQALTNDPAGLATLFPGLSSVATNYFSNVYVTNFTAYFTNYPYDPAGTPPHLAFSSNITVSVGTFWSHTFLNLFTITNTPNGWMTLPLHYLPPPGPSFTLFQTLSVGVANDPYGTAGSTTIQTNVSYISGYYTNGPVGDFFIMPSNACVVSILYPQLTNVIATTNVLTSATNTLVTTNLSGTQLQFEEDMINYSTQRVFVVLPVVCETNNIALRQGMGHIHFIRRDYDSLLTRIFYPITNEYVLYSVTNNAIIPQHVLRTVTRPDFLITASDLTTYPASAVHSVFPAGRGITFSTNNAGNYNGDAGPGLIEPPTVITFNNIGPLYYNAGLAATNAFLGEATQQTLLIWGSFDGTTNPPALYPDDVSIDGLESQVLVQISPMYFPDGMFGQPYSAQMQTQSQGATPWLAPFTWSLSPGSPALPPGLGFFPNDGTSNSNVTSSAVSGPVTIGGTPLNIGFYDFVIRVTDNLGRTIDRSYAINIPQ